MSMRFYLNGTSLVPKVYYESTSEPGGFDYGQASPAVLAADATSINGSTSIDMDQSSYGTHGVVWNGTANITPADAADADFSVLLRCKFGVLSTTMNLWALGSTQAGGAGLSTLYSYIDSGNLLRAYQWSDNRVRGVNNVSFGGTWSTGVWYDIGMTYDNSTGDMKFYQDATLLATTTSTQTFSSYFINSMLQGLYLGISGAGTSTRMKVDEFIVWGDEIVDFTATGLNANGASRSSYITYTPSVPSSGGGGGGGNSFRIGI